MASVFPIKLLMEMKRVESACFVNKIESKYY